MNPYESPQEGGECDSPQIDASTDRVQKYRYRRHIRWVAWIVVIFALPLVVLFTFQDAVSLARGYSSGRASGMDIGTNAVNVLALVVVCVVAMRLFRMANVVVTTDDEAIVWRTKRRTRVIRYADVIEVKCPSVRYVGGWIKVVSGQMVIRLTVVVQGIGNFVRELKTGLDRHGQPACYDETKLFRFFRTAEYADQSWSRLYETFWRLIGIYFVVSATSILASLATWVLFSYLSPVVVARLTANHTTILSVSVSDRICVIVVWCAVWVLGSLVYSMIVWLVAEFALMRTFVKGADRASFSCPARDRHFERRVYKRAVFLGLFGYCLLVAAGTWLTTQVASWTADAFCA